jgi:hypothetical protein
MDEQNPSDGRGVAAAETPKRRARGVDPLSVTHRRRLLRALSAAAANGDVGAQSALVELGLIAENTARVAEALARLQGDADAKGDAS